MSSPNVNPTDAAHGSNPPLGDPDLDAGSKFAVNVPLTVLIGIISALLLVVIMVATEAWFHYEEQGELAAKTADSINYALVDMRSSQHAHINRYAWAEDKDRPRAVIPISMAMNLLVQDGGKTDFPAVASAGDPVVLPPGISPEQYALGEQTYNLLGCVACHTLNGADKTTLGTPAQCPTYKDLFGSQVPLESGETVLADEAYIRESIMQPQAKIHKGYPPNKVQMPQFPPGTITDEKLDGLVAFIKSHSKNANAAGAGGQPANPATQPAATPASPAPAAETPKPAAESAAKPEGGDKGYKPPEKTDAPAKPEAKEGDKDKPATPEPEKKEPEKTDASDKDKAEKSDKTDKPAEENTSK